ncbi:MAG: hypothetical protein ACLVG5_02200 [Clostridium sp.]
MFTVDTDANKIVEAVLQTEEPMREPLSERSYGWDYLNDPQTYETSS